MIKRLAIIPARGGSKRIPNKNVKLFCGKPMISYILNSAQKSMLFDTIHVSTDKGEIKSIVENMGFPIDFMRSPALADDFTPLMPVLKFVTDSYASRGQLFDQVWLLMACAPLIGFSDLQQAAKLFEQSEDCNSLLAVTEYPVPIEWAFSLEKDGRLKPVQPGMFSVRSQDLEKKYFEAGIFAVYSSSIVQASEGAGSDADSVGFVLPKRKAIDIDDEADWATAEALYRERNSY